MKINNEILAIISSGECDGPNFRLTTGQLDRKVYQEVAKVLDAVGGKWSKRAKALVFDGDAEDAIEQLLLTGEVVRTKQEFGQFDTPPMVAAHAVTLAGIRPGMLVLEPNCGVGNLVAEIEHTNGAIVTAIEIDEGRLAKARLRCVMLGGYLLDDFLKVHPAPRYDRIVMNPPFGRRADVRHVVHAEKFLAPGGRLVAIMSVGAMYRLDRMSVEFRAMVEERGGVMIPLPEHSFRESGTSVNTCMVAFGG